MAAIQRFEELECWQAGRQLARLIYQLSGDAAFAQDVGLREQMRQAAVTVVSSIAEGFEGQAQASFIERLYHARAAVGQLRAQSYIALDGQYIEQSAFYEVYELAERCARQLHRLIVYLETQPGAYRLREQRAEYVATV
jgi:four helix bundle protein